MSQVYRLFITPQTKINISDNEKWLLSEKVTEKYLIEFGKRKRAKQLADGKDPKKAINAKYYLNRKRYLLTYFDYKRKVRKLFNECGLSAFPSDNVWFRFYIPMPRSWSKKKRSSLCFEKHEQTPDSSNLHKSLEDACSDCDRKNWDYRASKFWVDTSMGYIEIEVGALQPAIGYKKFEREDKIK